MNNRNRFLENRVPLLEYTFIITTALIPLFFNHPFRINLFLAWEGAFRLANGEIPYRDFGSPVGYGFWILPAIFFKLFGPYVYNLLLVQAMINIISGIFFLKLLKRFSVPVPVRTFSIVIFILSYSLFNFWPWYNHLVFVYELIGLYFLLSELLKPAGERKVYRMGISAFFIALSFMTKQDTGVLGFCICLALMLYDAVREKRFRTIVSFIFFYTAFLLCMIVPFMKYDFAYWFNLGQFPHNARINFLDILNEFFGASQMIKFYILLIVAVLYWRINNWADLVKEKKFSLFALLTIGILAQASIIQVTSYTPIDGNIYYHSFVFAFISATLYQKHTQFKFSYLIVFLPFICLWWSGVYWKRFIGPAVKGFVGQQAKQENVVSKNTYLVTGSAQFNRSEWRVPSLECFKRVKLPVATAEGIERLMELPVIKRGSYRMLNMSELTPLAAEMKYPLERDPFYPLWYHKGVSFFDREVVRFCEEIKEKKYDIILFEDIPELNNFYPYEVRECIRDNYQFAFKFLAPRIPESSYVEVYIRVGDFTGQ